MARDIVVIGASAGGVTALRQLVGGFPPGWNAAVFVALHMPATGTSFLPRILSQAGPLTVKHPMDGEPITPGIVCVAPPGSHMMLDDQRVSLVDDPRQSHCRPSVDTLFRSAAAALGPRVVGAILTGNLRDGSLGLSAIRSQGGATIVQDPHDARFPAMPLHARRTAGADHCVPLAEIAPLMVKLTTAQAISDRGRGGGPGSWVVARSGRRVRGPPPAPGRRYLPLSSGRPP